MKKFVFSILSLFTISITTILIITFVKRLKMDFNSEGRYFDEDLLVVYEEQSKMVYGFLSFLFLMLSLYILKITFNSYKVKK